MNGFFIINGRAVLRDKVVDDAVIAVDGGTITDTSFRGPIPENARIVDAGGGYILPGFVDMHLHGAGGSDVLDGTEAAFINVCKTHLMHGTTALLPTAVSCSEEELDNFFDIYRAVESTLPNLSGIHLEGPYLSGEMRGAQPLRHIRVPKEHEIDELLDKAGDIITMCSAAPELEGAELLARKMLSRGVTLSVAHSNATCIDVKRAYDWGFHHITHLYSNTPSVRKINLRVFAGIVEAAYLLDGMTFDLIGDGKHVPRESMQMALKIKGVDKISLITDAMRAAGTDVSESYLGKIEPQNRVIIEDGVAMLPDKSYYAGSITTMDKVLKNAVVNYEIPLIDAVRMVSLTPAETLGVQSRKGSLCNGKDADIVIMDSSFNILEVIAQGVVVKKS